MTAAAISWRTPMVVLIGGSLIAVLTFGIRADFGLLMAPISSTLGWGREIFGFSLALQNLIWGISQPLAGAVADKFGSGRVLAAGGVLYAAGVALMAVSSTPGMMHLTAGLRIGVRPPPEERLGSWTIRTLGNQANRRPEALSRTPRSTSSQYMK